MQQQGTTDGDFYTDGCANEELSISLVERFLLPSMLEGDIEIYKDYLKFHEFDAIDFLYRTKQSHFLFKKGRAIVRNFTKLILYITFDSGDTIEIEQTSGGSHMWDFNIKDVTPPDSSEGLRYGEPREGDFLNLILEQDEIISVRVQFHPATHKIYRFDIDPAGLQELFEKL